MLASFFSLIPAASWLVWTYDAAVPFAVKASNFEGGPAVRLLVIVLFVVFVPVALGGLILVTTRFCVRKVVLRREPQAEERGEPAPLPADSEAILVAVVG